MAVAARDAVVVAAIRTPVGIGKASKGELAGIHSVDLSAHVISALVKKSGVDPAQIEDVIWGCVTQIGEQSSNIARNSALAAGLPESVVGTTVDRACGSSQQTAQFAAASVVAGHYDMVVAGGVESMSRVPMFSNAQGGEGPWGSRLTARYDNKLVPQGISAEMIAKKWGLSRDELDLLAVASHERAAIAASAGLFADEITSVPTPAGVVDRDQGIRPDTTLERLAALKPAFDPEGVVTAGNSSQLSDGAAALLITTSEKAKELGLTPLVRYHTFATVGVDPVIMLTGPIPATEKVLRRAGLALSDIGAFEVNEAFATVLAAWYIDTGADPKLTNPLGGAIALGHPLGGSGARIATTLVHHMCRNQIRYGLQTMCEGGGMANATIMELL